jgi:hypothetical protein
MVPMTDSNGVLELRVRYGAEEVARVLAARRAYFAGNGRRIEPRLLAAWGDQVGFFKPLPLPSPDGVTVLGCPTTGGAIAMFVYESRGQKPIISATVHVLSAAERFNGEAHVVAEMVEALRASSTAALAR